MLFFGRGNYKLSKDIYTFSLPAGRTCPGALECKAWVEEKADGGLTVKDGEAMSFRCYAASDEARYRNVFISRKNNLGQLLQVKHSSSKMEGLIASSLPKKAKRIRVHVSGDFFSQRYFDAWMSVATHHPKIRFYAYTKAIRWWVARLGKIPPNFNLVASYGGKYDEMIAKHNLRYVKVVETTREAKTLSLALDKDDSRARGKGNFALRIHGIQPKKLPMVSV